MANWYIGQEIIAIVTMTNSAGTITFKKDDKFVIQAIRQGCSHSGLLFQIGILRAAKNECHLCHEEYQDYEYWFSHKCFAPKLPPLQEVTYEKIKEELKVPVSAN